MQSHGAHIANLFDSPYRPSTGQWFVLGGNPEITQYGDAGGDIALPLPYAIRSVYFP